MPTGRTDELERRFGRSVASAITMAYLATIERTSGEDGTVGLSIDERLTVVQGLIAEAESGRVDEEHLSAIAMTIVQGIRRAR